MVAYKAINVLISGLIGLGFSFIILSYFYQEYADTVRPVFMSLGWSMFGAQNFDNISYAIQLMPSLGAVCLVVGVIIWGANWA